MERIILEEVPLSSEPQDEFHNAYRTLQQGVVLSEDGEISEETIQAAKTMINSEEGLYSEIMPSDILRLLLIGKILKRNDGDRSYRMADVQTIVTEFIQEKDIAVAPVFGHFFAKVEEIRWSIMHNEDEEPPSSSPLYAFLHPARYISEHELSPESPDSYAYLNAKNEEYTPKDETIKLEPGWEKTSVTGRKVRLENSSATGTILAFHAEDQTFRIRRDDSGTEEDLDRSKWEFVPTINVDEGAFIERYVDSPLYLFLKRKLAQQDPPLPLPKRKRKIKAAESPPPPKTKKNPCTPPPPPPPSPSPSPPIKKKTQSAAAANHPVLRPITRKNKPKVITTKFLGLHLHSTEISLIAKALKLRPDQDIAISRPNLMTTPLIDPFRRAIKFYDFSSSTTDAHLRDYFFVYLVCSLPMKNITTMEEVATALFGDAEVRLHKYVKLVQDKSGMEQVLGFHPSLLKIKL